MIGAGILSLGPIELAKMVGTMHATGTDFRRRNTKALARFGKFFMGELWDTYIAQLKDMKRLKVNCPRFPASEG